ncbi:hypothetical protein N656DRAFT_767511 [Canariomyces notabilis]|uniref:Uncharacterized protein n=1 Tax=Canariomyces notabilis TaxID=2074819 RepID=A0AAN6TG14_9PEZI|nr:hypothetical protein N656DRAFT_767511 [Canariomyces arenarius]
MVAAVLVAGGLVAGLTVGERVEGVDPFNFTMFAWILAGFIILIAKGIWVSDWPWRDFLHARVTCRSARELRRVTHLSDRELLVLLLWLEQQTLTVSGPYNGPFTNCATGEGFSIDIPSDLKALLASGLVPVQVGTLSGPKIVFMSFRKDGRLRAVSPRGSFSGMILCSKDITGIAGATRPTSQPQLHEANKHMMEKQQTGHTSGAGPEKVQEAVVEKLDGIKWLSVYGIYEPEEQLFR